MLIKAVAVDDEPPALEIISFYCGRLQNVLLEKTFTDCSSAFMWIEQNHVDLLFVDISMPDVSGLELYESLSGKPKVIFTTSHSEYAIDGFSLQAVDYLLKPYTFKRLEQAIDKVIYFSEPCKDNDKSSKFMMARADYGLVKIIFADIIFIEAIENYSRFYLTQGRKILIRSTVKALLNRLPSNDFVQVHRSYIVSIQKIENLNGRKIKLASNEIPIGNNFAKYFFSVFRAN